MTLEVCVCTQWPSRFAFAYTIYVYKWIIYAVVGDAKSLCGNRASKQR